MPLTGYSTNTLGSILSGAGILAVAGVPLGLSRGGFTFNPGKTLENVAGDGLTGRIKGLERPTAYAPSITGTLLQASDADLTRMGFGTPVASGTSPHVVETFTPPRVNTFLGDADYAQWVELIVERGDGHYWVAQFRWAEIVVGSVRTVDLKEAEFPVTVNAVTALTGNPATDVLVPPFQIITRQDLFQSAYA